ncbi:MAG: ribosome assembly cofactor RimP [Chlorobiaceae bacterium]|nr:ribosome assembly cofactor RimP [Chlorobiaceae bacterium]
MKVPPNGTFFLNEKSDNQLKITRLEVSTIDKIRKLIEPVVEADGAFIIDIEIHGGKEGKSLQVYIDTDSGISTQMCASISRDLSKLIDEENIFTSRYYLVVSSPGLDRPLKYFRQYRKNIGRTLKLKVKTDNKIENIQGVLSNVFDEEITIKNSDSEEQNVKFSSIVEAIVETPW